jgi:hypothetical protein
MGDDLLECKGGFDTNRGVVFGDMWNYCLVDRIVGKLLCLYKYLVHWCLM